MLSSTLETILATSIVSLLSLIGIFTLSLSKNRLHKILNYLVAYSAGTILGASMFDLMPEAIELVDEHLVFQIITFGFIFFLFLERVLYWYHGHGHNHELDYPKKGNEENVTSGFASELIPEIHDDRSWKKSIIHILFLLMGLLTIYSLGFIFPHE
jgi:hypothetical protein